METRTLKQRILSAFTVAIMLLAVCVFALGFYVVKKDIFERTQMGVVRSLDSARTFYEEEINRIGEALGIADLTESPDVLKKKLRLDYFNKISVEQARQSASEIVRAAVEKARPAGGTRIIGKAELADMDSGIQNRASIEIEDTPKARPTHLKVLESVMAKEYALPLLDKTGQVQDVVYGGRVINRDYALVDRIRKLVFGDEVYHEKPVGTVTIFQDDVRISTNVLNERNERAIGTRVSEEVYNAVVEKGQRWLDRAFVVTHWYKTAYEPIRNINGQIIGILYVGILEQPFNDMAKNTMFIFLAIVMAAAVLAVLLSFILAARISRPLTNLLHATAKLSTGELGHTIATQTGVNELDLLAVSFNQMSEQLHERDKNLKMSNEMLADLNKRYIDLIGFVSHELNGIVGTVMMNVCSVGEGHLGDVNLKQKKALDGATRSLDYLTATVKKFLNLGRIEKGQLEVKRTTVKLKKDVFDVIVESALPAAARKNMKVCNEIDADLNLSADADLLQIVANNLVSNAVKYGLDGGTVVVRSRKSDGGVEIEVYNDSVPITAEQKDKLFRRFSRLDNLETKSVKGTGLGLFIAKQIVDKHGGKIWVEPKEKGNSFIFQLPLRQSYSSKENAYV